jgi:hypothetical protein
MGIILNRWLSVVSTLFWIVLMISLLPKQGAELFATWDENKKQEVGQAYANSQYVKGDAGQQINDGQLYLYAGLAYTQGQDPTTINFEHPPLGKYLWGISWHLFNNPHFLNVVVVVIILFTFFVLGERLKISVWLLICGQGLLVFILRPISLIYTLLDYQLLAWTLLFFLVVCDGKNQTWKKYAVIGLIIGAIMATKYPIPNIFPYLAILLQQAYVKKNWKILPFTFLTAGSVYLLSYWFYFTAGHNLFNWLQFEKYRLGWWTGDRPLRWYLIWQLLFFGGVQSWWEQKKWHADDDWNIIFPVLFVLSVVMGSLISYCQLKKNNYYCLDEKILLIWYFSLLMMGLYTFGSAGALRYLMIVAPCWYLTIAYFLTRKVSPLPTPCFKHKPTNNQSKKQQ